MNKEQEECEKAFLKARGWNGWTTFRNSIEYEAWKSCWNIQQKRIDELEKALKEIVSLGRGGCVADEYCECESIAKSALERAKE